MKCYVHWVVLNCMAAREFPRTGAMWQLVHDPCWPFPSISHLSLSSQITLCSKHYYNNFQQFSIHRCQLDLLVCSCLSVLELVFNLRCNPDFLYLGTFKPEVSQHSWQCSSFLMDLPRRSQMRTTCANGLLLFSVQSKSSLLLLQCLLEALWLEGGGKMLSYALYTVRESCKEIPLSCLTVKISSKWTQTCFFNAVTSCSLSTPFIPWTVSADFWTGILFLLKKDVLLGFMNLTSWS